ncbi:MAG: hypothetical protein HOZ81_48755 [Streptomyces sp.]|nr:hypothetical protein [Streptomyces sp.]NUS12412.1 hypothetical protein [Streptomyces sp.]NUS79733.1 hypothetical protein [Streptomyces sp.]
MDEFRHSPSAPGAGAAPRRFAPPPALCGFLLLLALMFTVSYAVGAASGPVAPGMHGTGTKGEAPDGDDRDMDGGTHGADR